MPLQNRVDPWGEIHAVAERGTMMGNRGGRFHRDDRTLGRRRWASRHWICCDMHYKGLKHEAMGHGYTSLFFLDEVTALAAGHRPCFYCRRADAKYFLSLADPPLSADEADRIADEQRRSERPEFAVHDLPDGAVIAFDGIAYAVQGGSLLAWSFAGYTHAVPRKAVMRATLLTPLLYVGILARGYVPRWHATADELGKGIS
ncbi:MAG: hypothetical protein AB7F76_10620 [Parvibaculaceae bacterium]